MIDVETGKWIKRIFGLSVLAVLGAIAGLGLVSVSNTHRVDSIYSAAGVPNPSAPLQVEIDSQKTKRLDCYVQFNG